MKAALSLGANLGDRGQALRRAVGLLNALPDTRVTKCSGIYETAPVGVPGEQPDYLNCAVEVETAFPPQVLLGMCLGIETSLGRVRTGFKSPRTLDIDLLACADEKGMIYSDTDTLRLPHPRMFERAFVLVPLGEIYPDRSLFGRDISSALADTAGQHIERVYDMGKI